MSARASIRGRPLRPPAARLLWPGVTLTIVQAHTNDRQAMDVLPGDLEQVVEIGTDRFLLRPVRPEDHRAYADFFARIDAEDLRRRFFHPNGLSPEILFERYAQANSDTEAAFVALRQPREEPEDIVGEVRIFRYAGTSTAELAIIVRSDMQRRGLGRALMQKAVDYCASRGLEMIAQMRPENEAMIGLAKRSGMQVDHQPGSNLAVAHLAAGRCEL